ncbi:hypothetical protein FKM82_003289 [Ascaphus truei]
MFLSTLSEPEGRIMFSSIEITEYHFLGVPNRQILPVLLLGELCCNTLSYSIVFLYGFSFHAQGLVSEARPVFVPLNFCLHSRAHTPSEIKYCTYVLLCYYPTVISLQTMLYSACVMSQYTGYK